MNAKTILILVVIFLLHASNVLAAQKAVFPNSSALQPVPIYVHPNISGNISSHSSPAQKQQYSANNASPQTQTPQKTDISSQSKNMQDIKNVSNRAINYSPWAVFLIGLGFAAIAIVIFYLIATKGRKKQ
jgi:hypothetical protein